MRKKLSACLYDVVKSWKRAYTLSTYVHTINIRDDCGRFMRRFRKLNSSFIRALLQSYYGLRKLFLNCSNKHRYAIGVDSSSLLGKNPNERIRAIIVMEAVFSLWFIVFYYIMLLRVRFDLFPVL